MIHIDQDPDQVPERPLRVSTFVIALAIVISVIATIVLIPGPVTDTLHVETTRPTRSEADPFVFETPAERLRANAERHLDSYGWVDRATGTIHVPLDVAIEHYLGGRR